MNIDSKDLIRELLKLSKLPTPNADKLKDIALEFDSTIEKVSKLEPALANESAILLLQSLIKYDILKPNR